MRNLTCRAKMDCIAGGIYRKAGDTFMALINDPDDLPSHLEIVDEPLEGAAEEQNTELLEAAGPKAEDLNLSGGPAVSAADLTSADMLDKKTVKKK